MNLLLDTHAFIWFINGNKQLPSKVTAQIRDTTNKCYISIASIWEIAIKCSLGRLELKDDFNKILDFLLDNEIELLPIAFAHTQQLLNLEYFHRDPFDRIIISQALCEKLSVVTKDENFKHYSVNVIW